MRFVNAEKLKVGMRLAKPIYNKNGVMLYERNSKLSAQGIVSIRNFGLIGVYILEPAEPVPPMSEEDVEFERFQAMAVFTIREILDDVKKQHEPERLYQFANQIIKNYGTLNHKINFIQSIRSLEDNVYKHSINTAILSALIAKRCNLEFKRQLDVVVASILFEVGTLMLPISLRTKPLVDITEEDIQKINTYYVATYQLFRHADYLDAGVKSILTGILYDLHNVGNAQEERYGEEEIQILRTAAVFDEMTAMNLAQEPMSDIAAIRILQDPVEEYDQKIVSALLDSINILEPGVCVEFTNGDRGLVIVAGAMNVLEPHVLSFHDNQIYNLADQAVQEKMQIKDIMKTMDNRHVVDMACLEEYRGKVIHMGQK